MSSRWRREKACRAQFWAQRAQLVGDSSAYWWPADTGRRAAASLCGLYCSDSRHGRRRLQRFSEVVLRNRSEVAMDIGSTDVPSERASRVYVQR